MLAAASSRPTTRGSAPASSVSTAPPGKTVAPGPKTARGVRRRTNTSSADRSAARAVSEASGRSRTTMTVAALRMDAAGVAAVASATSSRRTASTAQVYVPLGRPGSPVAYASGIDPRRQLPSVDHLLHALDPELPHGLRVEIARSAIDDARERVARGEEVAPAKVLDEARRRAAEVAQQLL